MGQSTQNTPSKPNPPINKAAKSGHKLQAFIVTVVVFLLMLLVSFVTPIFSYIGLYILQALPTPEVKPTVAPPLIAHHSLLSSSNSLPTSSPSVYVVLGGGLTQAKTAAPARIVLNDFSQSRVQTVLQQYQKKPLPIVLSGVESPWMKEWLVRQGINPAHIISENASMNTCENARFTAKLLQFEGKFITNAASNVGFNPRAQQSDNKLHNAVSTLDAPINSVYLVTGKYHMTRAQRQFALSGIASTPINAPLPEALNWFSPSANYRHSKRTLYEIAAYLRDVLKPQQDCRQADEVSIQTLKQSRKKSDLRVF